MLIAVIIHEKKMFGFTEIEILSFTLGGFGG